MSSFGKNFRITTWGESHGKALGVVVEGMPVGLSVNLSDIQKELNRRRPGQSNITTARQERDHVKILSGVFNGTTTGAPIMLLIQNEDRDSSNYEQLKDVFRPGHADFTYYHKYEGYHDYRGGGRSSGRETAARVAAGALAKLILQKMKIHVIAYVKQIGHLKANTINLEKIENNKVRCPDPLIAKEMEKLILKIKDQHDSIGGMIEVQVKNCPKGLGDPVFNKLDAQLAHALMSIGAVKGVSVGSGFRVCTMKGSENNDMMDNHGFQSNHAGGILGGISTGEDIKINLAVKPTPSITIPQKTITKSGKEVTISIQGRHDPCICPRIVPVVEAMVAITLADYLVQE